MAQPTTQNTVPPTIDRVDVDPEILATFKRETDFTSLSVSLLREVASYVCVAACTLGESKTWDRDKAAIGGNMVRLYKLSHAYLDQACQYRGEISLIIGRLLFETVVNIKYLIANFSKDLIDAYIKQSLRQERLLRDTIQSNIESVEARGRLKNA
jgi:hypothetical protein